MRCRKCGQQRGTGDFYASSGSTCKTCVREAATKSRLRRIDAVRQYDRDRKNNNEHRQFVRDYAKTPKGRAALYRSSQAWRKRNRHKQRAHNVVAKALLKGLLFRGACECGCSEPVQAHHDDYSRPLDVRWVCDRRHKEIHREEVNEPHGDSQEPVT